MIKLGEIKETGDKRYSHFWLIKHELGCYGLMVLVRDTETGNAKGWSMAITGTLKECREYAKTFFTRATNTI